jgi:integrase/recombinase XerD
VVYLQNDRLFSTFLKEKQFLDGASPTTIRAYSKAWLAYHYYAGCTCEITEARAKGFMVSMTEAGEIKPGSANAYARSINSFLSWLFENGHTPTHLRVPLTSVEKRVLQTYTPEEVRKIISHKPQSLTGKRVMALLFLLIDTGARVSEALSLTRKAIDFENLLVTLKGKGNKQRRVPISIECRRRLYQWLNSHDHDLVFCTTEGGKLRYDNLRRDFLVILRAAKVEKTEGSFHAFRRFFGKQYIRNGGNPLYLQKVFGHASLQMTQRYVDADEEDLQLAHKALSPLESLKSKR